MGTYWRARTPSTHVNADSLEDVEMNTGLSPDVENALYDILIRDEQLEACAAKAYEDLEHMSARLRSLDFDHPAYESLSRAKASPGLVAGQEQLREYNIALEAIDDLNNHQFMSKAAWLTALAGVASVAAPPPVTMVGVSTAVGIAGVATFDAAGQLAETRAVVNRCIEFCECIISAREEFDAIWSRMVDSEDPNLDREY